MFAIISICCCIATIAYGQTPEELISDTIKPFLVYDDLDYSTIGPSPEERAENEGYTAETHTVETEDGYLLDVHRVTGSKESPASENKTAVLVFHGIFQCSATWLMGSPQKSLGYLLADKGYDVWLGNTRGNRDARNHTKLSTKDKEYWMFSWHEIGMYDLTALIDYILEVTGQKKLIYVGYSQGTTIFFAMASMRTEFQDKVDAMFALAPVAYLNHSTLLSLRLSAPIIDAVTRIFSLAGIYEYRPTGKDFQKLAKEACRDGAPTQPLCVAIIAALIAPGERLLNKTLISEFVQYDPAGISTRQFQHFGQLINSGRFCQFDHGPTENMKRYNSLLPPEYPLEKIKTPIYLYYSSNDGFVNIIDLLRLYKRLPNCQKFLVPEPSFTHIDFVWSKPMDTLVYKTLLSDMENHK